jgi:hypothetical protein
MGHGGIPEKTLDRGESPSETGWVSAAQTTEVAGAWWVALR